MDTQSFKSKIGEIAEKYQASGCVAFDGEQSFSLAFGGTDRQVREDDLFCLSLGRSGFTGLIFAVLSDRKILSLDEKISRWLPEYPHADRITVLDLLMCSSGIPDYISAGITAELDRDEGYRAMSADTRLKRERELKAAGVSYAEGLTLIKDAPLLFEPGERGSEYSSTDDLFLCEIARRVCGLSMFEIAQKYVFEPAGMTVFEGNRSALRPHAVHNGSVAVALDNVECPDSFSASIAELRKLALAFRDRRLMGAKTWREALRYNEYNNSPCFSLVDGFDVFSVSGPLSYSVVIWFKREQGLALTSVLCDDQHIVNVNGIWRAFRPEIRRELEGLVTYYNKPVMRRYCERLFGDATELTVSPEQEFFVSSAMEALSFAYACSARMRTFVLCEGERAVGLLILEIDKKKGVYCIDTVIIDRRFQRRGYGRFMVRWGVDYLKGHGATELEIGCNRNNVAARALYESVGFVASDIYDEGVILKIKL